MPTLYDFTATTITGRPQDLSAYRGNVVLVVNTASKCGLTPQFTGLEELYARHADTGLVILGFPSDQFMNQEFGEDAEIAEFCRLNYGVTFPMFSKVDVNGQNAHPVFNWLRTETGGLPGDAIEWNFTKFLVDRDGRVVRRYAPTVEPAAIEVDLVKALAA